MNGQVYAENKKAYYDYEILEKFEAGLVLQGQEVKSIRGKSIRGGHITLTGSYVVFDSNLEPCLIGSKIPPYQPNNVAEDYKVEKTRKILLNKKGLSAVDSANCRTLAKQPLTHSNPPLKKGPSTFCAPVALWHATKTFACLPVFPSFSPAKEMTGKEAKQTQCNFNPEWHFLSSH